MKGFTSGVGQAASGSQHHGIRENNPAAGFGTHSLLQKGFCE